MQVHENDIDGLKATAIEHILITDFDTKDVLVNQRGVIAPKIAPVETEDNADINSR